LFAAQLSGACLQIETAQVSLIGDREDNQDRVGIIKSEHAVLLVVLDGMGGHSDGSRAAETAFKSIGEAFSKQPHPLFDPLGFMHMALSRAHDEVVRAGSDQSVDSRPRATAVMVLVQEGVSYWGHVGDSRIYQIRHHNTLERTRDHSHVELLLREGRITEADIPGHPMRNFVECCLGGDPSVPEMSIAGPKRLQAGDVLLLCTDGIWGNFSDEEVGAFARDASSLQSALEALGKRAVKQAAPHSDNSTAAALRLTAL
jgi:PPM family protein phosphatase